MQEGEEDAASGVETDLPVATSLPPSSTDSEEKDAVEREPAPETAAIALAKQPESTTPHQLETPAPSLAVPATTAATTPSLTAQFLSWFQLVFAGAVLVFGLLWWRSRS
jgi:hypothetical protein